MAAVIPFPVPLPPPDWAVIDAWLQREIGRAPADLPPRLQVVR